jgi:hypothetical protein
VKNATNEEGHKEGRSGSHLQRCFFAHGHVCCPPLVAAVARRHRLCVKNLKPEQVVDQLRAVVGHARDRVALEHLGVERSE